MRLWKCSNDCRISSETKGALCPHCKEPQNTLDGVFVLRRTCGGGMNYYNENTVLLPTPDCGCIACCERADALESEQGKAALTAARDRGVKV